MAVKVYTNARLVDKDKYIKDVWGHFKFNYRLRNITDLEKMIIKEIDNAELIDDSNIQTPFGITSFYNISNGSKAVINVMNFQDKIFNVTSCGANALDIIFKLIDNTDIKIVLNHADFKVPEGIQLLVNDKYIVDSSLQYINIMNNLEEMEGWSCLIE